MPPRDQRTQPNGRSEKQIEFRAADADLKNEDGVVAGYLSTSWVVDSYGTAFTPDAWDRSVRERGDKLFLLYQHWPDWAIGKLTNVTTDDTGLAHESQIVDDGAEGTVALKRLRAGVPFGHSVGFRTLRERPATEDDPLIFTDSSPGWARENPDMVYVIEEAKLYEGSIVTFAANDTAVITSVRNDQVLAALSDTLEALRDGRLTPAHRALIADLAAAWERHAAAGADEATTAPDDAEARDDRDFALEILLADCGLTLEDVTTAA